jgi:hypothetical protein
MDQGTQMVITVVRGLRAIAKMFPETAPMISDINNKMRDVSATIMKHQEPGQPAAPPMGA